MSEQQYTTPDVYKKGLEYVLDESRKLYEAQRAAGYQPYQGPRIATFAPEELAAMQGIADMVGAGQRYFAPAEALTYGQTQQFGDVAQQYMSPYQQAVIDVEKREAIRQAQRPRQDIAAAATRAGSFGGSRQAILEAEQQRNLQQRLGDIQTRGSQAAYETGLRAFEAQKERERAAASGLAALGQAAPQQALRELTALSGVGEAQRGLTQAGMDIGFQEFQKQKDFPYSALGQYQSALYGYPFQAYSRYDPVAKPSGLQNLAGILGAGAKIGSAFGFFKEGGKIAKGGLSGMMQKLNVGSIIGSGDEDDDQDLEQEKALQAFKEKEEAPKSELSELLTAYGQYMQSQEDYSKIAQETLKERERLSQERLAELEKQDSPMNYIADLLIGYSAADPEAGIGAQLGGAAEYAGEQKAAVTAEINKIKDDLAEGKLTQAEANAKMAKLGVELQSDLYELGMPDIDLPSRTDLIQIGEKLFGEQAARFSQNQSAIADASLEARQEAMEIIAGDPGKYSSSEAQYSLTMQILREKINKLKGGVKPETKVSETVGVSGSPEADESAAAASMNVDDAIDNIN